MKPTLLLKKAFVLTVLVGGLALGLGSREAQAQSAFCPASVVATGGTQTGFALVGGDCTNGPNGIGAFSNAALAAQALGGLSQSASLESTNVALEAISARRRVEVERCPDNFVRINGVCEPVSKITPSAPPTHRTVRHKTRPANVPPSPVYKAPAVEIAGGPRFAVWANGFGDYEKRSGTGTSSILCCTSWGAPASTPLVLNSTSRTHSWGVVAGADATFRDVFNPGDGLIAGLLTGYVSSDVQISTTSTSTNLANVGNGGATFNARLKGPSLGAYLTYFNGGFSADLTEKVDFLSTDLDFTDSLNYTASTSASKPVPVSYSGSGSTSVQNFTTVGNLNYRLPLGGPMWIEPTVGFQYTAAVYSSGADALGLADGHVFRIQGGSRLGMDFYSGTTHITPVLTGLVYDDVSVSGGFVTGGVFLPTPVTLSDEGKLRGEGILAVTIANANGISGFIQGQVYGGEDLIGYGGKVGLRVQFGS